MGKITCRILDSIREVFFMELKKDSKTIIIGVITILTSSIIPIIYTSYFFEFLFITILIIILGITIYLIKHKMNKKEERPFLVEYMTPTYIDGYVEYPEKKLKWCIKNRETFRWIIKGNPICPKCNEKLEQKEHYLWYEWICNNPNCNYNTYRTWNHKTILMYKVEKLIKNKKS